MALTERQRDRLLDDINKKLDKVLRLIDPPTDEHPQRVVKRDPGRLYNTGGPS